MTVIEHSPHLWFLLEEDGELYLGGRYQSSFAEYAHPMRLNAEEKKAYRQEGRGAIARLFKRVQHSAPILAASTSAYKTRKEPKEVSDRMHRAILAWNASR